MMRIEPAPPRRSARHGALGLALALALALAGCRGSGDPCRRNDQCAEGGVCLKGACAAYPCAESSECEDDQVCAAIGGNNVCVLPCEADDACPGEQTCEAPSDAVDGERFCL